MKMGANLRQFGQAKGKVLRHDLRIQRTQADTRDPRHGADRLHQFQKAVSLRRLIGRQMNPRQNNLPVTTLGQTARFLYRICKIPAADPSSGIGNNTVGTDCTRPAPSETPWYGRART